MVDLSNVYGRYQLVSISCFIVFFLLNIMVHDREAGPRPTRPKEVYKNLTALFVTTVIN